VYGQAFVSKNSSLVDLEHSQLLMATFVGLGAVVVAVAAVVVVAALVFLDLDVAAVFGRFLALVFLD